MTTDLERVLPKKMDIAAHSPVGVLCLFVSLVSPMMGDFNAVKDSCSKPCQLTVDACKSAAQLNHPSLTNNCDLMKANINGVTAYKCLVRNGFCTESEFIKLKNEACRLYEPLQAVSQAKTVLYQALSETSSACQNKSLACIQGSGVATVLKQQEHFCDLVNIITDVSSSQTCLTTSGCSTEEFNRMKAVACSSTAVAGGQFAKAIVETTPKCKGAMEACTASSESAPNLLQSEQYCLVMSIDNGGTSTKSCLVDSSRCTQDEFDKLKTAACGVVPGYSSFSSLCQLTIDSCRFQAQYVYPGLTDACTLIRSTFNEVTAFQCLVKTGFCTENEFIKLKNEACGVYDTQQTVSAAKSLLYKELSTTTISCQRAALECIIRSSVATVLKQQEKYCALLNISTDASDSHTCLTLNACTSSEFNIIRTAACSSTTVGQGAFSNAIIASSKKCKGAMETCTESSDTAIALIQGEQYCRVMNIVNNSVATRSCLVEDTKCTQSEFDALTAAACGVIPGYASVSKLCQITVDDCRSQAQYVYPGLTDACTLLTSTFNYVTAFQCLVKIGFCTENEFIQLKNEACKESVKPTTISTAKTVLYEALSSTSVSCQISALTCLQRTSVATVLKQQERYCALMYINNTISNSQECLTIYGCSLGEFETLRTAACSSSTVIEGTFSNTIIASAPTCKGAMETCTESSDTALALIQSEQYCKVMNIANNGMTTYSCLVANTKCSQSEFDSLRSAACGSIPGYTSVSKLCQMTVDDCRSQALYLNAELTDTCKLLKTTFNDVTAYQCLVRIGFCTENEFTSLEKEACGNSDNQKTTSSVKTALYNTLRSTTESCQRSALLCVKESSVATVLKQQESYCDLLKIVNGASNSLTCLTAYGCSEGEFNSIKTAACSSSTVGEGTFASAIMGTTPRCKSAMEACTVSSDTALALIQSEQYCKVMTIDNAGATSQACLVNTLRCTKSEFETMKHAACTGSNLYAHCLVVLLATLAVFL